MACGDKYSHLVRTASGLTARRRYSGIIATEYHYSDWHDAAMSLLAKVNRQWSLLRKAELEREAGTPLSDELLAEGAAYSDATRDLPQPWDLTMTGSEMVNPEPRIDQAVDVMAMGACQIEKINEALEGLGLPVPEIGPKEQPKPPGIFESIQTVAMIALVGAAAYGIAKLVIMSRKQPALPAAGAEI